MSLFLYFCNAKFLYFSNPTSSSLRFPACFIATIIAFPSLQIFHYQSFPHPTTAGKFKDRISWVGNVANGDASIAIQSPELSDNGTFICSVKNPPDLYHNIPQTVLVVTERGKAPCPEFGLTCVLELLCGTLESRASRGKCSLEFLAGVSAGVTSAPLSELSALRTTELIWGREGQGKLW